MEAVIGQIKITKNSKRKTKNHNASFENGGGSMKKEGNFLNFIRGNMLGDKNPSFSMLHSSCLIYKGIVD